MNNKVSEQADAEYETFQKVLKYVLFKEFLGTFNFHDKFPPPTEVVVSLIPA